ncbi:M20/M25/M40 family metallo-hydrolase [candidate division KSB1 bacterium]|nr:M20/M25/M40 family metallo-hydrolase [candidate division KSB1 bacterium]
MIRFLWTVICVVCALFHLLVAKESVDEMMVARIKIQAFQNSQLMETLSYLTDVHGPRLTNSPNYKAAAQWCVETLEEWGLDARLEPWGSCRPGWSFEKVSLEMTDPFYVPVLAYPMAWSPGTNGDITGKPVVIPIDFDEPFDSLAYKSELENALILNPYFNESWYSETRPFRHDEDYLEQQAAAIDPGRPDHYTPKSDQRKQREKEFYDILRFFKNEQIAAMISVSPLKDGVIQVSTPSRWYEQEPDSYPWVVVSQEQGKRLQRMLEKGVDINLKLNVQTTTHPDTIGQNVIAEIAGTDRKLKNQVVMLGGHLDSWHAGTGATDNASGCAIMMEAVRILKKLEVKPRRTIRLALWGGEEQGYLGSRGYVKKHFGDPETMELGPEHELLSAYFNIDNGGGKLRGIYLQGNEMVRPIFSAYLEPFAYLGAGTVTAKNTSGTDHIPFNWVGLPGFQFIQDPLDYGTKTWHTHLDVFEKVIKDDVKQAAAIVATFVYHTAMRDEMLPRESPVTAAQE